MTVERVDSSSGTSPVAASAAPSQVSSSKMSPGQGFGRENYVFLTPTKNTEQEQKAGTAREGFNSWAAALGFTILAAMVAALLISIIWTAAPGYNPMRFSGGYRSTEQPPQPDFSTRANCSQEQQSQRCQ